MFSPSWLKRIRSFVPDFLCRRFDPFETAIDDFVAEIAAQTAAGERILDAGSGEGRFAARFCHARYVPVDLAIGDTSWNYSAIAARADLADLPFCSAAFDKILCIVVLEHTRRPDRVLAEMSRVLASRGRLYLVAPLLWEVHQAPHDFFRFTEFGMRWLAEQANLNVLEIRPIGGLFWVLSRRALALLAFFGRGALWPLFLLLSPLLGLALPLLFYWMDRFDKQREYTLGYRVVLEKPSS